MLPEMGAVEKVTKLVVASVLDDPPLPLSSPLKRLSQSIRKYNPSGKITQQKTFFIGAFS